MPNYCIKLDGDTVVQMREDSHAEPGEIVFSGDLPNIPEHMRACHLAFDGHALRWVDEGSTEPPAPTREEIEAARAAAYRERVLPASCTRRVAVEAGSTFGWRRYVGDAGLVIGIDHFGASAPAEKLAEEYGFTADRIAKAVADYLA